MSSAEQFPSLAFPRMTSSSASNTNSTSPSPFASPNPIPPRRSSTGVNRNSVVGSAAAAAATAHTASATASSTAAAATNQPSYQSFTQPAPLPSLLSPVVEGNGFSAGGKQKAVDSSMQDRHRAPPPPPPRDTISPVSSAIMHRHHQQHQPPRPSQPPEPNRYAHEDLDFTPQRSWTEDKEKVVRAPFDYVSGHAGKDFRSQLINAFNSLLQVPADRLDIITRTVGMLHESSLLVDDVQDSSELRRGFPVAHNIFGVAQTINAANYIYFVALQELQRLNNPRAVGVFAEELVNLHRGQGMDLFWRDTLTCPTEDDYLEMVGNKTGGLFRLGIKLMQAESASTLDCVPLVNLVGLIFQIRDDYMNLSSAEYTDNKGLCEDLTEGKFSFPVIHSIRANPANMQLINILKQKTTDIQVKRYAVSYMESTGSFDYTRSVIAILIERARRLARDMAATGNSNVDGVHKILDRMVVDKLKE
ncbi:geranylgeranyl diphosphate synthase [Moelleriella libera RCEF 2490]|uniref:Geranylgeranyl diphosphate synthase n=1 Tax=Moelleriella libera RCEF 2490 TaxID=1081109 RepID=A0A166V7P4_9HYPO|nr:geranylgeranyl diphosphate synthase [Moelleriella libera RCEF 2490]